MADRYIRYCRECVMPDTKPDLHLDEAGVCNACSSYKRRMDIDWDARHAELLLLLDRYRSKNDSAYDCIVPVSGGKDSHFQVLKMLELGMNPLCVTATTDELSAVGRRNIENLKKLGVDYIEVTTNPVVRRRINRLALLQIGDISWPEHLTIFTIPVRIAVQMKIPLIVWGENSQNEYGGPAAAAEGNLLTRRWLEEFGGLLGLRVTDLIGHAEICPKDLILYTYPSNEDLSAAGVTGIFLGYYLPWDGYGNALYAQAHGFETHHATIEGSLVNYENLDNIQMGIHDYFKFIKYAFGRASDLASMHVRRKRLTRSDALRAVRLHDGRFPWTYLGYPLEHTLGAIGVTMDEFMQCCDTFTNRKLFACDSNGLPAKDHNDRLTKINYDNVEAAANA